MPKRLVDPHFLFLACFAALSATASAANWVPIAEPTDSPNQELISSSIDIDSLQRNGDVVYVWQKATLPETTQRQVTRNPDGSVVDAGKYVRIPATDLLQQVAYDCKQRTTRKIHMKSSRNGAIIFDGNVEGENIVEPILPATGQEVIMGKICKRFWEFWK